MWDYIEEHVTLPRIAAFIESWQKAPPLQEMVAAFLGYEPANGNERDIDQQMVELMAMFGEGPLTEQKIFNAAPMLTGG